MDFGIAEVIGDTRLTAAGAQVGSFAYMAPERFGGQEITPAIDIYALTCVLYEALTGEMPFQVDTPEAVVAAHLAYPPPRPSEANPNVPVSFDDVIARGMAKEPDDRYGSAGALGRAANRALKGLGSSGVTTSVEPAGYTLRLPQPSPPAAEAPRDRARWLVPTVIAVSAALVLGGIGVVIALLVNLNTHAPAPGPTISTGPVPGLAPLVTGPDQSISHTVCDQGFQVANGTGYGTHAGRGSAGTSCFFANSVMLAYWNTYGNASTASAIGLGARGRALRHGPGRHLRSAQYRQLPHALRRRRCQPLDQMHGRERRGCLPLVAVLTPAASSTSISGVSAADLT